MKFNQEKFGTGLQPLPEDQRDLLLGAIFRLIDISQVPKDSFVISEPLKIKDQKDTDLCSAFAVTSVSEDQEGIELSPEYQFAKIKELMNEWTGWGADLRTACKSLIKKGSLPASDSPYNINSKTRDFLANWLSWDSKLDYKAQKYTKDSYLKITGPNDHFDNIRATLWQFKDEKRSIVTGAMWKMEWLYSHKGIIPETDFKDGFGHAFKIFGQKVIDGNMYLVAQLSNGIEIGDGGIFYFPRKVINENVEKYGAYMFKDVSPEKLRFYQENNAKIGESGLMALLFKIISFFNKK